MAVYGLRSRDTSGNIIKLTPDFINIDKTEQAVMPAALVDTNKYYATVDLSGTSSIATGNIGVITNAFRLSITINAAVTVVGASSYGATFFANNLTTQYTKNLSTGVMTAWTPGINQNPLTDAQWDLITAIYPDVYWDKLGDTSFTFIKLFGAMRYSCYDSSATAYIDSYILGGVEKVDYTILLNTKETI